MPKKLTQEEFIKCCKEVHGDKYDYSKTVYKNKSSKVTIICPIHGEFEQRAEAHYLRQGCPKCVLKAQSKLQKAILTKLPELELEWEASPEWLGKMRFDLYSSKYNFEIEHHGIQHYQPIELFGGEEGFQERLKADALKTKLCNDNNCKQFIMKYDYTEEDLDELINNIKQIIDNYDS